MKINSTWNAFATFFQKKKELGKVYDSICKLEHACELRIKQYLTARQTAATKVFRATLEKYSIDELMTVLKDSIPPGASIGEMIIHSSDELTILYGKVPPKFQSAVHNHTIFACICCLIGHEQNTIYTLNNGSMDVPPMLNINSPSNPVK